MSMDAETLITSHNRISSRGLCYFGRDFALMNVLLYVFFSFIACQPSCVSLPEQLHGNDPCGPSKGNYGSALSKVMLNDLDAGCIRPNSKVLTAHGNVCTSSELFCFTSTLRGILSERPNNVEVTSVAESFNDHVLPEVGASQSRERAINLSWSSDRGMSVFMNGRTVMCSLGSGKSMAELSYIRTNSTSTVYQNEISSCRGPLLNQNSATFSMEDVEMIKFGPDVEISPPILDWGEAFLYVPSLDFITAKNNWKDRILHVYQPISFDAQFFPCNFTEAVLGPGEVSSICFVFLPKYLGLSSAHLIFQTSSGGFLVQAKGYTRDSPYGIQPLIGLNISSGGSWRKNLTLFNPFDESICVEEITIWMSNGKDQIEGSCTLQSFPDSNGLSTMVKDWFLVRTSPVGSSLQMVLRLHQNWTGSPQSSEKIVEPDFSFGSAGKVLGAFCMQLTRLSQHSTDIIMVPIEAEIDHNLQTNDVTRFNTVSLESLANSEAGGVVVAISLRISGQCLFTVLGISNIASSGVFRIKHMEGLLLFPGTITRVATVTCAYHPDEGCEFAHEMPNVDENCKLLVQTNDSTSQIDIPCRDIIHLCNGKKEIYGDSKHQSLNMGLGDKPIMSNDLLTSASKVQATVDSDEMVLRNLKSQGSDTQSSVLDDDEVFFSVVPIGSRHSKWITVHNPNQHPIIMQLLLNSGEMINNCRDKIDGHVGLVSSGRSLISKSQVPTRDGFSLAEDVIMEVIVNPFEKVSWGHLIFYPLKRCEWRSSALVRNYLSCVEWLPVLGMGGSQALMIFEGAKPARKIEFELKSSNPSDILDHNPMSSQPCSGPLTKVLSILNSGDLTLEVQRIRLSGTDCGLNGFVVQNCSFFNLQPGESAKLLISYQSKFLSPLVRKDFEMTLATGIFVLPLKATIPIIVIGECRRSLFWLRAKKIFAAVLVMVPCAFFIFCCFYPRALGFCAPYYFSNGDGETIPATHKLLKSSKVQYSKKYGRFTLSTNAKHLPSLVNDDKASLLMPNDEGAVSVEHGIRVENGETRSRLENLETTLFTQEKPPEEELPSGLGQAENGVTEESTLPTNLTVRIGKEKGRRRRKRKGAGSGLTALIEVSSSYSGNSMPSSPQPSMSSTTFTPQRAWPKPNDVELCLETQRAKSRTPEPVRSPFSPKPTTLDHPAPTPLLARPKVATKPILLPSATFPGSSHHLSLAARITPHTRAPGSRLCGETAANAEDKVKKAGTGGKEFTYDIWGDHFSAIYLIGKGRSRDDKYARMPCGIGIVDSYDSDNSFFVKGPQALLTKYRQELSDSNEK